MQIKETFKNGVRNVCSKQIKKLRQQKKELVGSVATITEEKYDIKQDRPEISIWSQVTPGGYPTNTIHEAKKDNRPTDLLKVQLVFDEGKENLVSVRPVGEFTRVNPSCIFGGVSQRKYRKLKSINKKILFWQQLSVNLTGE